MRVLGFVGLFATVVAVTPLSSQTVAPPAKEREKKLCRNTAPPTGTRMGPGRICKTAAEWESARQATERDMELRQRSDANASEVNGAGEPR